ncbi:MAG: acyloxyacyl hydrolase [Syntrophorhabdales bacterium]|jgi:hypothetical protein
MKGFFVACLLLIVLLGVPVDGSCGENGFSLGYGFAAYNEGRSGGKIEGGKPYNFVQAVYVYEKPFSSKELALLVEPFTAYVNQPNTGVDLGVGLGLKYYPLRTEKGGFYLTAGTGMAYTSIGFQEQGTHLLFILQGGIGYRYGNLFVEDRFRHYSNGGTASPNWSINANIISIGTHF